MSTLSHSCPGLWQPNSPSSFQRHSHPLWGQAQLLSRLCKPSYFTDAPVEACSLLLAQLHLSSQSSNHAGQPDQGCLRHLQAHCGLPPCAGCVQRLRRPAQDWCVAASKHRCSAGTACTPLPVLANLSSMIAAWSRLPGLKKPSIMLCVASRCSRWAAEGGWRLTMLRLVLLLLWCR